MPRGTNRLGIVNVIAVTVFIIGTIGSGSVAHAKEEPGRCSPPCRSGFSCSEEGKCVSLCNPPCKGGERCVEGECELMVPQFEPKKRNYLGLFGVFHAGLNDYAQHLGEVRVEFGGAYASLQAGPVFGHNIIKMRTAILGHIPFQPLKKHPYFFMEPMIALGYSFGWLEDGLDGQQQDIFLTTGLRLRYDLLGRLAVLVELIQVQVTFLRLYGNNASSMSLQKGVVPVSWNLAAGLAFLY